MERFREKGGKQMKKTSRRKFLTKSGGFGAGILFLSQAPWLRGKSPNDKLNIAAIGAGGRGAGDIWGVASENIVALCDVDFERARGTFNNPRFRKARKYKDFRVMLEKEEKNIDAVVVATPDHTHAVASVMAMKMGKHCYCEKPLTHDVYEARIMREIAEKKGLATQMGNQGTSTNGLRRGVEVVQDGVIGQVREVHVWTNRPIWPQGVNAVLKEHTGVRKALHGPLTGGVLSHPIRDTLAWDLWLGPAPERPFTPPICLFAGAAGGTLVPAPWATWPAIR